MQLPEGYTLIPNTDKYAYYPVTNLVLNLEAEKVLSPNRWGSRVRTRVVSSDGKPFYFYHDTIESPEPPTLTREQVLQDARIIPDYSRYAVTALGVIYCIGPSRRGRGGGRIYIVNTHDHQGWDTANLVGDDGKRRKVRVDRVVSKVWDKIDT